MAPEVRFPTSSAKRLSTSYSGWACVSAKVSLSVWVGAAAQPVRALLDKKPIKSAEKRWNWVRRGAPIIVEIGPRDAAAGNVTFMRRDALRDGDKVKSIACTRAEFLEEKAVQILAEIQHSLYAEAKHRLDRGALNRRSR